MTIDNQPVLHSEMTTDSYQEHQEQLFDSWLENRPELTIGILFEIHPVYSFDTQSENHLEYKTGSLFEIHPGLTTGNQPVRHSELTIGNFQERQEQLFDSWTDN